MPSTYGLIIRHAIAVQTNASVLNLAVSASRSVILYASNLSACSAWYHGWLTGFSCHLPLTPSCMLLENAECGHAVRFPLKVNDLCCLCLTVILSWFVQRIRAYPESQGYKTGMLPCCHFSNLRYGLKPQTMTKLSSLADLLFGMQAT